LIGQKRFSEGKKGLIVKNDVKLYPMDTNFGAVEVSSTEPRLNDHGHHLQCIAMQIEFQNTLSKLRVCVKKLDGHCRPWKTMHNNHVIKSRTLKLTEIDRTMGQREA
jgi:hypothetical protein